MIARADVVDNFLTTGIHWTPLARVLVDEHKQIRAASQRVVEVDAEVRPWASGHPCHCEWHLVLLFTTQAGQLCTR